METLEEAQARITELEGQVTALAGERDAAVGLGEQLRGELAPLRARAEQATSLGEQVAALASERDVTAAALAETQAAALEATRRALLAEHAGQVVPELVTGETVEELPASVETARGAFTRVADAARASAGAQPVPTGAASGRSMAAGDGMSPLDKISAGLSSGRGQGGGR